MTTDTTDYEKLRDVYDWLVQSNKSLNAEIVKQALITFDRQAETIAGLRAELQEMKCSRDDNASALAYQTMQNATLRQQLRAAEARAVPQISDGEMASFNRFCDICEDFEAYGYDVPKEKMQRLARIGLVRWCGGSRFEVTDFGYAVRNGHLKTQPPEQAQDAQWSESNGKGCS